jgi:hypothetical protein
MTPLRLSGNAGAQKRPPTVCVSTTSLGQASHEKKNGRLIATVFFRGHGNVFGQVRQLQATETVGMDLSRLLQALLFCVYRHVRGTLQPRQCQQLRHQKTGRES